MPIRFFLVLICAIGTAAGARAQDSQEAETLMKGELDHGFILAFDEKLSSVDGKFANFVGGHGGWLINHRLLLGGATYGSTNEPLGFNLAYGGFLVEYFFNPEKVVNYSIRGVVGAGGIDELDFRRHRPFDGDIDGFFVAEPEARVNINVAKPFRIGFGVGYRFTDGEPRDLDLSGPTFTISLKFGIF